MTDHFKTLGLERSATAEEVVKKFRTLAKEFHPDVNKDPAAKSKFQEISNAYSILSDREKRAHYEAELDMIERGGFSGGFGGQGFHFHQTGHDMFGDMFQEIFRQHAQQQQRAMNVNININCNITLEESFYGKTTKLVYSTGTMAKQEVEVTIPPGINHGERIVFQGRGLNTEPRMQPGHLFVTISIQPHAVFRRDGSNLITNMKIDPITPIIGGKKLIKSIDGKIVEVVIPPLCSEEYIMIPGHGMPMRETRGNLFVVLEMVMPTALPDKAIPMLRELRDMFDGKLK